MPRPRERINLQAGLSLNLATLRRQRFVVPGCTVGPRPIRWSYVATDETIAEGLITASMEGECEGWLRIRLGQLDQTIVLIACPRHFGGRQWYFMCPVMNRRASVLWKPPGATRFCSRQTWGRQVAYSTQFMTPTDRAHHMKAKISTRLSRIGGYDPNHWDFPPKPKGMRWRTYNRFEQCFERYENVLDAGLTAVVARFLGQK